VDDINEPTPCTLLYVEGRTLMTIDVADDIVMDTHIMHGRPIPSECVVVEGTTIREGHEFENLDNPDEEEVIEKLKDAKGNFILWPRKDIILKTCSSSIISLQNRGLWYSNFSKYPTQHCRIYSSIPKSSTNYPSS
jgi:hypothetical protein